MVFVNHKRGVSRSRRKHFGKPSPETDVVKKFKFKSFNEQIDNLSINSINPSKNPNSSQEHIPAEISSWFEEGLFRWRELNCTLPFARFCSEVHPLLGTLPQILFNKEQLMDLLLKYLDPELTPNSRLAVVPLSNLIALLARDLGIEFLPRLESFILRLFTILSMETKDAELVGAVINSIFFLVKFLEKRHCFNVFKALVSIHPIMLTTERAHLRRFFIQLYGYVIRKLNNIPEALAQLQMLDSNEKLVARILVESVFEKHNRRLLQVSAERVMLETAANSFKVFQWFVCGCLERSTIMSHCTFLWKVSISAIPEPHVIQFVKSAIIASPKSLPLDLIVDRIKGFDLDDELLVLILKHSPLEAILRHRACFSQLLTSEEKVLQVSERLLSNGMIELIDPVVGKCHLATTIEKIVSLAYSLRISMPFEASPNASPEITLDPLLLSTALTVTNAWIMLQHDISLEFGQLPLWLGELITTLEGEDYVACASILAYFTQSANVIQSCLRLAFDQIESIPACVAKVVPLLKASVKLALEFDVPDGIVTHPKVLQELVVINSLQISLVIPTLSSHSAPQRLNVLQILEKTIARDSTQNHDKVLASAIQLLLKLEQTPWNFNCDREKRIHFDALFHLTKQMDKSSISPSIVIHYLYGVIFSGIRLVQTDAGRVLGQYATAFAQTYQDITAKHIRLFEQDENSSTRPFPLDSFIHWTNVLLLYPLLVTSFLQAELVSILDKSFETEDYSLAPLVNKQLKCMFKIFSTLKISSTNSNTVEGLLYRFLAHGDSEMQRSSLEAIFSLSNCGPLKNTEWRNHLKNLLTSEASLREALLLLSTEHLTLSSDPMWEMIVPLIIRIVYGRMISKEGSIGRKNNIKTRRKAIINYLAVWTTESLELFCNYILVGIDNEKSILGFLNIADIIFAKLINRLSTNCRDRLVESIMEFCNSPADKIRSLAFKRLFQIFKLASINRNIDLSSYYQQIWDLIILPRTFKLVEQFAHSSSSLLDLFVLWAQNEPFRKLLWGNGDSLSLLSQIAVLLKTTSKVDVLERIVTIFEMLVNASINPLPIEQILDSIAFRLKAPIGNNSKLTFRLLSILIPLAGQLSAESPFHAQFVSLLTDMLSRKSISERTKTNILQVLASLQACVDPSLVSRVLMSFKNQESFVSTCKFLTFLSTKYEWLQDVGPLIAQLYATSGLGEPDYEIRLGAFSSLRKHLQHATCSRKIWSIVLPAVLFCLFDQGNNNEESLRTQASFVVNDFIEGACKNPEYWELVTSILLPAIRIGLKRVGVQGSQEEALTVFGKLVAKFPQYPLFAPFVPLQDEPEASFFSNMFHVQVHRRVRTLRRLAEHIPKQTWPLTILEGVLLPLLRPLVVNTIEKIKSINPLLHQEANLAFSVTFAALPDASFNNRLQKLLSMLKHQPECEKSLLKVLPLIISKRKTFDQSLLPTLFEFIREGDQKWIPLTASIGHLLQFQEDSQQQLFVPKLFTILAVSLRNKEEKIREQARSALGKIVSTLGPKYMSFLLQELQSALYRGAHKHILVYTIHAIINTLVQVNPSCSLTEPTVGTIMQLILEDLFGSLSREKSSSEWTGKMLEVRSRRGFELLSLIVSILKVETVFPFVIYPLYTFVRQHPATSDLEKAIKAIEKTIPRNDTISLFSIAHELVNSKSAMYKSVETPTNDHQFQLLGLELLNIGLKYPSCKGKDLTQLVDPFVALVEEHLYSKHTRLIIGAIRVFGTLVSIDQAHSLASLDEKMLGKAFRRLFELIATCSNVRQVELVTTCFKLVSRLVKGYPELQLTESQIKALLVYARDHLESNERQSISFSLVSALLAKRVMLVELFDLVHAISQVMLTSPVSATRQACRGVYSQFLLDFPLGPEKHEEHFGFILKNVAAYEWESGRESALQLLHHLIPRLSLSIILSHAEAWIVTLASRLANESNQPIKDLIETVLQSLAQRLDDSKLESLFILLEKWINCSNEAIQALAWHLIRLFKPEKRSFDSKLVGLAQSKFMRVLESDCLELLLFQCLSTILVLIERNAKDFSGLDQPLILIELVQKCRVAKIRHLINSILSSLMKDSSTFQLSTINLGKIALFSVHQLSEMNEPCEEEHVEKIIDNLKLVSKRLSKNACEAKDKIGNRQRGSITCLADILNKLEGLVRRYKSGNASVVLNASLKFMGALLMEVESDIDQVVARPMLSIGLRIAHDGGSTYPEEIRPLAGNLVDLLEVKLGVDVFTELAHELNRQAAATRLERRQTMATLAIKDPEAFAKRKLNRNEAKKLQRKRKIDKIREKVCKRRRG